MGPTNPNPPGQIFHLKKKKKAFRKKKDALEATLSFVNGI